MWQSISLIGNVGRDAEMSYTPQGIAVCKFSIAVNKVYGKGENRKERTTWFRVTVWRDYAEVAAQYIRKGMRILVVGEVNATAYIDKQGKAQATLEVTCDLFKMLDRREEHGSTPPPATEPTNQGGEIPESQDTSDVPF